VLVPAILTNTPLLKDQINGIIPSLRPDVVRLNFEVGSDVMASPSVFFNIVLTDAATHPSKLRHVAQRVSLTLMYHLQTEENGIHAYFNFRSKSEASKIEDPAWAEMQ
jgi:hypothetical protein